MFSYADRVAPRDRWAIAAYIRALHRRSRSRREDRPDVRGTERMFAAAGGLAIAALLLSLARPARPSPAGSARRRPGLPTGALMLPMIMRLIPRPVGEELRRPARRGALWPLAALRSCRSSSGWWRSTVGRRPADRLRGVFGSPGFFVCGRSCGSRCHGAVAARARRPASAGLGPGADRVAVAHFVAVDWLMSLDPAFDSSGVRVLRDLLRADRRLSRVHPAAALAGRERCRGCSAGCCSTLLLIWAYFDFMPYLIIWSGNLPPRRSAGTRCAAIRVWHG